MSAVGLEADPLLGKPLANYPSDRVRALVVAGIIGGIAAVILNFTVAAIPEWWAPPLTVILMAALVLGLGWYILHIWNREIILYDRGFTYQEGSRSVPFHYEEITAIRLNAERLRYFGGLIRRNRYHYRIVVQNGDVIEINGGWYKRAGELGTKLSEQVNALLIPRLQAAFDGGDTLHFGDLLSANRDGFSVDNAALTWEQFSGYSIGGGKLAIHDQQKAIWFSQPLGDIDNITLLISILKQHSS